MITLHNPYSVMLDKNPVMKIPRARPVLTFRGCNIWKLYDRHYVFEKDGVVFSERVAKSTQVVEEFLHGYSYSAKKMREAHNAGINYVESRKEAA